jgi:hypothetical protein
MTGLNGEQAGGSVSRRGLQVAARLAALWCDARLAVGLARFVGRNGFALVLALVGIIIPYATIGGAGIAERAGRVAVAVVGQFRRKVREDMRGFLLPAVLLKGVVVSVDGDK